MVTLLVFELDGQRFALHLDCVGRVLRAVEITRLPEAPCIVAGVINVEGLLVPVVDLRRRFGLPERPAVWTDQIVLAMTSRRMVGLLVDRTAGVIDTSRGQLVAGGTVLPHLASIDGVVKTEEGLIVIHDLERCLSLEDERILAEALEERA